MYPQDLRENWHAGQGLWKDVPAAEWNDWHWQMRNRITTLAQLEERLPQNFGATEPVPTGYFGQLWHPFAGWFKRKGPPPLP